MPENEHCKRGKHRSASRSLRLGVNTLSVVAVPNASTLTLERIRTQTRTGFAEQASHETVVAFVTHRVVTSTQDDASGLVKEGELLLLARPELVSRRHVGRQRVAVCNQLGHPQAHTQQ
jgi:hypothetical protein